MNVSQHPVRILLSDDLERDRLTVFFRWLLSIPHFIWLALWTIVAFLAALVNWLATLALGRSPAALHRFLATYVKYVTQFYAYLHLAADPYPSFSGQDRYPVDLAIAAPAPQRRLTVAFRGLLFLPAALIVTALVGAPSGSSSFARNSNFSLNFGLLHVAALLGWFAIMARGRMPRGLRDIAAYGLFYGAQFWAYALLLTDRYPDSDPQALPGLPVREDPIRLDVHDDLRRSRLSVFFRLLLALPHLIWLELWGIVVFLAAILNWFATLIAGRSPTWLHRFLCSYLRYQLHVYAYLYLIANPFPGFVGRAGSYPLELAIAERARQNRWKTGFRVVLALPALLVAGAYGTLATAVALLGWFSALARGRMPSGLRNLGALALRYQSQLLAYLLLLTDAYPYSGPVATGPDQQADASASSAEPRAMPDLGLS